MTHADLDELLTHCPVLFHMAESGAWASIRRHGLLSTSALLDLYEIDAAGRAATEAAHRPRGVVLARADLGRAVVRDQKPMDDASLTRCLQDGLAPRDWYRLLNSRVFFWLSRKRLVRLLCARPYRAREHDVLELDTRALVAAHSGRITLSPINSGATRPFPVARGRSTFLPIAEYPYAAWRAKRPAGDRVVELAVQGGITDVTPFVLRVSSMCGEAVRNVIYTRHVEALRENGGLVSSMNRPEP